MAALDVAIEIGLEVFVLDLGWANQIGDWFPDPIKFPNGLSPLVQKGLFILLYDRKSPRCWNKIWTSHATCTGCHDIPST